MYLDANKIPDGTVIKDVDICIVGSGAAGIAMAAQLASTTKRVLVISSGPITGRKTPTPADQSTYNGQIGEFMKKVDPPFLTRSRLRMYGGTTNHFGYWARPLDAADLKARPGYRDAHWPFDIDELNKYYPRANDTGDFGPFNYDDINFWIKHIDGHPFPARDDDPLQNAIFHAQYDRNISDFQIQFGPILEAAFTVTVIYNANVLTINTNSGRNHVSGLECRSLDCGVPNRRFRVEVPRYVLAQGGIEVVRLLKISGDLGDNARRHLGKGFMVHPVITNAAEVSFPNDISPQITRFFRENLVRIPCQVTANQPLEPIAGPFYNIEDLESICTLTAWGVLEPKPKVMDDEKIGNFRLIFRFQGQRFTPVDVNWEQVPNDNSTITIDPNQTDVVFNQPVVRLDWNLLEEDKRTIVRALDLCKKYLSAPGRNASRFEIITDLSGGPENWTFDPSRRDPTRLQPGDHHMGATRMSKEPVDGIVDPNLRVHSVDNLYIASCSVFPTSGYANPTLTIVALAFRLADHLTRLVN